MIYIKNKSNSPYYNLAFEEYVFNEMDGEEEYLLLWQNEPSVIIGKHQNTIEEINLDFIKANNINVARRISGGGAVYHDFGNLNFTFIVKKNDKDLFDFKKFTLPVINALKKLGVKAEFNSRNDLAIEGKKFSGNAQYMKKNKLLHHGTLLFDSDLERLAVALNPSKDKIVSKGIKSVRSRVTNISEHLGKNISVLEFKELLLQNLFEDEKIRQYELSEEEIKNVENLMEKKYKTWEWNYGESPKFNIRKSKRFEGGKVEALIDIKKGTINSCKFYGDFFGNGDLEEVETKLIGHRYEEQEIRGILSKIDIENYFSNISLEELLSCII